MRGVLGLAGITVALVALVLAMRFSLDHTQFHTASNVNGGRTVTQPKAQDSASFIPVEPDGDFRGLKVLSVVRGGIADRHFGLLPGDVIVGIGPFEMGDSTLFDFNSASDWVTEAYVRQNLPLIIERHGEELSLPIGGNGAPMAGIASGGVEGSNNPADKSPQVTNPGGDE